MSRVDGRAEGWCEMWSRKELGTNASVPVDVGYVIKSF